MLFELCYPLSLNQSAPRSLRFDLASLLVWQLVLILDQLFWLATSVKLKMILYQKGLDLLL